MSNENLEALFYWCDAPKNEHPLYENGAYSPALLMARRSRFVGLPLMAVAGSG